MGENRESSIRGSDNFRGISIEALQKLWEEADEKSGRAGGYTQGEIWEELDRRSIQKEDAPIVDIKPTVKPRQGKIHSPIDHSYGMRGIRRRGV
ncbi:MAG: hypothetical protein V1808_02920 [Candidatus Daviesbacteria bacterium]